MRLSAEVLHGTLAQTDPLEEITAAMRGRAVMSRAHVEEPALVRPLLLHLQSTFVSGWLDADAWSLGFLRGPSI